MFSYRKLRSKRAPEYGVIILIALCLGCKSDPDDSAFRAALTEEAPRGEAQFSSYIDSFPNGKHMKEVEPLVLKSCLEEVSDWHKKDLLNCQLYSSVFPQGPGTPQGVQIQEMIWDACEHGFAKYFPDNEPSGIACPLYAEWFPDGRTIDQVSDIMLRRCLGPLDACDVYEKLFPQKARSHAKEIAEHRAVVQRAMNERLAQIETSQSSSSSNGGSCQWLKDAVAEAIRTTEPGMDRVRKIASLSDKAKQGGCIK